MDYEFHLQDPTSPRTVYLFEALIAAAERAEGWRGIFAFASRAGVDALILDPVVAKFLSRAEFSMVVGLDAVTNRQTLERLQELEQVYDRLAVRVFWNRTEGLFHPKVSHFRYADGAQCVIVGSGNLTPGGLRENFEGYSVLRVTRNERLDLSSWDDFLASHAEDIRAIDDEALERAARNIARGRRRRRDVEPDIAMPQLEAGDEEEEVATQRRFLVCQVPRAGGRWQQVHFNRDVIDRFFHVEPNSTQRVSLQERRPDGSLGDEEVRRCVFSERSNRNLKIELGARRGEDYPRGSSRPIAIFKELQVRTFEYMLVMPGYLGQGELMRLTEREQSMGRGLARVLTDADTVHRYWPDCPLL